MEKHFYHLDSLEAIDAYSIVIVNKDEIIKYSKNCSICEKYAIGSMSKAFGAYLIQMLVDEKLCSWSDKVSNYFEIRSDMTLLDLVEHQVKFKPHLFTQMIDFGHDMSKIKKLLEQEKENTKKGFNYNNIFYIILEDIIEKITKKPAKVLLQKLLDQANMSETGLTNVSMMGCYMNDKCSVVTAKPLRKLSNFGFAGGIVTTIGDMEKWMKFMLDKTEFLKIDKKSGYGKGWWTCNIENNTRAHTGSVTGFSSAILMMPEKNFGVCCLCNMTNAKFPQRVINHVVSEMFDLDKFDIMTPFKGMSLKETKSPSGTYQNELFGKFELKDNKIIAGDVYGDLILIKKNEYLVKWTNAESVYYTEDKLKIRENDNSIELHFSDFYHEPMICKKCAD